jgi:phosphoribosylaminoimidazole carboxylase (NCAIR synthetase)
MRVSTTLLLAAMALPLGFVAIFQPASMVALMGQQQAGADCTSVWVNTRSHVYHFAGASDHGRNFYGHTREGAYMCEADARAAGNRAAFDEHHP